MPEDVCVEYVCGSHKWEEFSPYHFSDGSLQDTDLALLPDIEANRERYDLKKFAMGPGDCLVFNAMIFHGAPGNNGRYRRRAPATRGAGDALAIIHGRVKWLFRQKIPGWLMGLLESERFPLVWTARKLTSQMTQRLLVKLKSRDYPPSNSKTYQLRLNILKPTIWVDFNRRGCIALYQ